MAGWCTDFAKAPRDTRVLLWCSDLGPSAKPPHRKPVGVVFGAVHDRTRGEVATGEGMSGDWTFTHWRPLPGRPKAVR